jgi:hypothetical protein
VANFFYSYREGELQTNHSNMLRSVLYDILRRNEAFFFHFQSYYREATKSGESFQWPYDSLKKILLSFQNHPAKERLYLIVDAMDESDDKDRWDIIRLLHRLCATKGPCTLKVFLASRPIAGLKHYSTENYNLIKLQDENKADILKFAESFLGPGLELPPDIVHPAKGYIVQNA